jgi:hypothetical protein
MTRRARLAPALLFVACAVCASSARATDFDELARLVREADEAHGALADAPPERLLELRELALERDYALAAWLDAFLPSDEVGSLTADQRNRLYRNRYRVEFNATRLLIDLDRCDEARTRARSLLDSTVDDPELRPRLAGVYEEAIVCASRPRLATLRVDARPVDAELVLDGEPLGRASTTHRVPLGSHTLLVRADGYASQELAFEAATEGPVELGPVRLVRLEGAPARSTGPNALEWSLWGIGAAGVGTGLVLWLSGQKRQGQIDDLEGNQDVVMVDPEWEQQRADDLRLWGFIAGGVGLAAAVTGTILYLTRRGSTDQRAVSVAPGLLGPASPGVVLTFDY